MPVDLDVARGLANTFTATFKTMAAHKRRLPRPHPHADQSALPLLYALEKEPLRISALADAVHSDISTVSRQVTALRAGNLVTKVSDVKDRRAQLVALTDEGTTLIDRIRSRRSIWMQTVLTDWTDEEATTFNRLLTKFSASLETYDVGAAAPSTQHTS